MIDRRSFLAGLGAALSAPLAGSSAESSATAGTPGVFVSACLEGPERDGASVAAFDLDGRLLFATRLPARGHDVAARPGSREVVVFARRPGNWAAIVDRASGHVRQVVTTPPERHFFGHGVFSPDGRLLYATENDVATGLGRLGVYDATAGYARVDERPTHGLGPHDLALLPDGAILVANGGTRTHPGTGREILNPDAMRPSLAVVEPRTGEARAVIELGADLRGLSLRHLAVAGNGEAVFGCQWEGDPGEGPPLVGILDRTGATRFLDMPDDDLAVMRDYVGSVALSASGRTIAATSPRGGAVALWDRASGRYLGLRRLPDVCGVAPVAGSAGPDRFLVSSGQAGIRGVATGEERLDAPSRDLMATAWDNHLRAV